jgi:3-deoxy-manno-octulosonate cytidylyltransferase (CMP-KDO synthetase)
MVQHVYERASAARRVDRVLVATDDDRIANVARGFGAEAVMTSPLHASGTDRVAEAVASMDAELVVNVQGDEPMLAGAWIDAAVEPLLSEPELAMSTLSLPLCDPEQMLSPQVVKVVTDLGGDALYFSRSPLPHVRLGAAPDLAASAREAVARGLCRMHVGLYAYRREALLRLASLPPSPLEEAEGLEQLRALQDGMRIRVVPVGGEMSVAVDTPQDLERVRELMAPSGARP